MVGNTNAQKQLLGEDDFLLVPDLGDDLNEGEIEIKDEDLEVTTMRSGGAGGQHVNRTRSG